MDSTLSQAIKEAYASAPTNEIIYHTLELYHPAFTGPIRVVLDNANLTATLEATAPRNPSEEVTFIGYQFEFSKPEISDQGIPQCTIVIDNVNRVIVQQIELAVHSFSQETITATYREFLASDLTGPQNDPPLELTITDVNVNIFRVTATAGFPTLANKRFPTEEYTAERFPGLTTQ